MLPSERLSVLEDAVRNISRLASKLILAGCSHDEGVIEMAAALQALQQGYAELKVSNGDDSLPAEHASSTWQLSCLLWVRETVYASDLESIMQPYGPLQLLWLCHGLGYCSWTYHAVS